MFIYFISDSLTEDDLKKVEIIKKAVLIPEKNREKRKQRVKKYLQWVSMKNNRIYVYT